MSYDVNKLTKLGHLKSLADEPEGRNPHQGQPAHQ